MDNSFSRELALDSALASTKMEGFEVTEQTRQDCLCLLEGNVSVAELVHEISARKLMKDDCTEKRYIRLSQHAPWSTLLNNLNSG